MKLFAIISILFILCISSLFAQSYVAKSYYPSGKLKSEISFTDSLRDGLAKFYYENGNLKEERNYQNGRVEGTIKLYHENGNLSKVFSIIDGVREGATSLYDSAGNYTGDISYTSGKQDVQNSDIESSEKLDSSFEKMSYDIGNSATGRAGPPASMDTQNNDPAFFAKLDIEPNPVGGMKDIYSKLVYPEEAFKNNIKGLVEVLTFIDENGNVVDMIVIKGLGYGCDEAAKNAIRYTKFHPGFIKGVPVKSQLKISIQFNGYKNGD
jgi:TonB family protein